MPRPVTGCVRMSGVADQSGSALTLILAYDPNPNPYLNQKPSPNQKPNPITLAATPILTITLALFLTLTLTPTLGITWWTHYNFHLSRQQESPTPTLPQAYILFLVILTLFNSTLP